MIPDEIRWTHFDAKPSLPAGCTLKVSMDLKQLPKMNRLVFAGAGCFGTAIVSAALLGLATSPLSAIAFGLCIGIAGWGGLYRAQPDSVKEGRYPFVPTPGMLMTFAVVAVVSSFAVFFSDLLADGHWLKLAGTVGVSSCIGLLIAQLLVADD